MGKALRLAALAALLAASGCQTAGGSFCDLAKPIRLSPEQIETLTDAQVAEYLGHNERLGKLCGVKP